MRRARTEELPGSPRGLAVCSQLDDVPEGREGGPTQANDGGWPCEPACEEYSVEWLRFWSNVAQARSATEKMQMDVYAHAYLLQTGVGSRPETPQYSWAKFPLRKSGKTKQKDTWNAQKVGVTLCTGD